jgi:hypothetical protein
MAARLAGDGFVLEQAPAAGTPLTPGSACALKLGRQPVQNVPVGAQQ